MASDDANEGNEEHQEGKEEVRKIQESVRNEAAKEDDDMTPDGLAYRVNAFELEVERFLEVDSWNDVNGIDATQDHFEEKHVDEMKTVKEEGNKRRAAIKEGFEVEEGKLLGMDKDLADLGHRIEQTAAAAEKAAKAELEELSVRSASTAGEVAKNPFAEYRDQINVLESKKADKGMSVDKLLIDDSGARSRMERLRAESELLRKCLKEGKKGNFSSYSTTVAGK